VGEKFFYAQLIMGDPVDNIPGLPKHGPKAAFDILGNTQTREEAFKAVLEAYRAVYGDSAEAEMLEQGQLLWMVRELDEEGKPVMWQLLKENDENIPNQ
jgi:5'-3' exonuclease